jgi:tetratricopeptide (TPR) repeat protein
MESEMKAIRLRWMNRERAAFAAALLLCVGAALSLVREPPAAAAWRPEDLGLLRHERLDVPGGWLLEPTRLGAYYSGEGGDPFAAGSQEFRAAHIELPRPQIPMVLPRSLTLCPNPRWPLTPECFGLPGGTPYLAAALKLPKVAARKDDRVYLQGRPDKPLVGRILSETKTEIKIKIKTSGAGKDVVTTVPRAALAKVERAQSAATVYAQKAGQTPAKDAAAQLALGRWCCANELPSEARRHVAAAAVLGDDAAVLLLGDLARTAGDLEGELAAYTGALARETRSAEIHARMGHARLRLRFYPEAVEAYRRARTLASENAETRRMHAAALLLAGERERARGAFEEMRTGAQAPWAVNGLALLALREGKSSLALTLLRRASEGAAAPPEILNNYGAVLVLRGARFQGGRILTRAARKNFPLAKANLAVLNAGSRTYRVAAKADALSAARAAPFAPEVQAVCAMAFEGMGDYAEALKRYGRALSLAPGMSGALAGAARCRAEGGESEEAAKGYAAAMRAGLPMREGLHALGILAARRDDFNAARDYLARAGARGKPSVSLLFTQAGVALRSNAFEEAAGWIGKARKAGGSGRLCAEALAYLQDAVGNEARAAKAFQGLVADSRSRYARECLEVIANRKRAALLEDRFEREDGTSVLKGWREVETFGVEIALKKGRVVFSGTQKGPDWERTRMWRTVEKKTFSAVEAKFWGAEMDKGFCGLVIETLVEDEEGKPKPAAGLALLRSADGKVCYLQRPAGGSWGSPSFVRGKAGKGTRLAIRMRDPSRGRVEFRCGGDYAGRAYAKDLAGAKAFRVAIVGSSPNGVTWTFQADDFRLLTL